MPAEVFLGGAGNSANSAKIPRLAGRSRRGSRRRAQQGPPWDIRDGSQARLLTRRCIVPKFHRPTAIRLTWLGCRARPAAAVDPGHEAAQGDRQEYPCDVPGRMHDNFAGQLSWTWVSREAMFIFPVCAQGRVGRDYACFALFNPAAVVFWKRMLVSNEFFLASINAPQPIV